MVPTPIFWAVLGLLTACTVTDLRTRRIPNGLTLSGLALGLLLNGLAFGMHGLVGSACGAAGITAILVLPFALGGIGGGDVKMMAAVGALLGPQLALASLCVGVILGGLIMVVHLLRRGRLTEMLVRIKNMLVAAVGTGSVEPLRVSSTADGAIALPYSLPLALGTVLVVAVARL